MAPPNGYRPTTSDGPALAVPPDQQESIGLSASMPRHVLVALVALIVGGAGGAGAAWSAKAGTAENGLSRVEVEQVAAAAEARAKAYADLASARIQDDGRRELSQAMAAQAAATARLEFKIDKMTDELAATRADVAVLKARVK
jgi:hypothetical protein